MGSIRAALSGNKTGRQLLLNLKGAGDFLTWGQIYKPFPHTHTQPLAFHLRSGAVLWGHAGFRARRCQPRGAQRVWRARTRQDSGCQALHPAPNSSPGGVLQRGVAAEVEGPLSFYFSHWVFDGDPQLPVPGTAAEPGRCSSPQPWVEAEPSQTLHPPAKPRVENP